MPYAVALAKDFFKAEGANVTGILTSAGGGTTLRNMLAGSAPYAEVTPNAVVAAVQQGADLKIVSSNVLTVAEFVWVVKRDSPIKSVADLKGKKFAYTNPRSTSQGLATLVLQSGGLKTEDAELVKTGGFGEGIAALDAGLVDVAPMPEPLLSKFKDKYRIIASASESLPVLANVVGVVSESQAGAKADFIRAVIRARARAVAFMMEKPDEAGDIVAKVYNIDPKSGARPCASWSEARRPAFRIGGRARSIPTASSAVSTCRKRSARSAAISTWRSWSIRSSFRPTQNS
jgi:NitT/TauT family transport system substrate-binding protein